MNHSWGKNKSPKRYHEIGEHVTYFIIIKLHRHDAV